MYITSRVLLFETWACLRTSRVHRDLDLWQKFISIDLTPHNVSRTSTAGPTKFDHAQCEENPDCPFRSVDVDFHSINTWEYRSMLGGATQEFRRR